MPNESRIDVPVVKEEDIESIRKELELFSAEKGIPSITDRIRRGLSLIGVVAIKETNEKVAGLAKHLEASYDDVVEMVIANQVGGPWKYANQLKEASDPTTKMWLLLNGVVTDGKARELDMTETEFLADVKRINLLLDEALENPEGFFAKQKEENLRFSGGMFRIENDVPISELDNGFTAMAINGYEAGIIQDADGLLFVGAENIDDKVFDNWGLEKAVRDDGRGRQATFYLNDRGEAVVKRLYSGLVIVLSRNFDLAKAIVQSVIPGQKLEELNAEALGHTLYVPTSLQEKSVEELLKRSHIKFSKRINAPSSSHEVEEGEKLREHFYSQLAYLKSNEIFRDRVTLLRKKKREKGQKLTKEDLEQLAVQTETKVVQKMEELRYMMSLLGSHISELPEDARKIMDMAGGAGDLGMSTSVEMFARGKIPTETEIVDPVKELAVFNRLLVSKLDLPEEIKQGINPKVETLQEAEITRDSVVVAKHACGTLTDEIIENWVQSESPVLCIMTCCQDKAKDQPARYGISQTEWRAWCKDSAKTNHPDAKKKAEGMEAMTKLDEARVQYLKRHGFDAELVQTDQFPKGDVIIARRKVS